MMKDLSGIRRMLEQTELMPVPSAAEGGDNNG